MMASVSASGGRRYKKTRSTGGECSQKMSKKVSGRDVSVSDGAGPGDGEEEDGGTRMVSRMQMAGDEEEDDDDVAPAAGDSVARAMMAAGIWN
jgi:hypothetical protein